MKAETREKTQIIMLFAQPIQIFNKYSQTSDCEHIWF